VAFSLMARSLHKSLFNAAVAMTLSSLMGSSPTALAQSGFHVNKSLYSETADSANEIDAAERVARHGSVALTMLGAVW